MRRMITVESIGAEELGSDNTLEYICTKEIDDFRVLILRTSGDLILLQNPLSAKEI